MSSSGGWVNGSLSNDKTSLKEDTTPPVQTRGARPAAPEKQNKKVLTTERRTDKEKPKLWPPADGDCSVKVETISISRPAIRDSSSTSGSSECSSSDSGSSISSSSESESDSSDSESEDISPKSQAVKALEKQGKACDSKSAEKVSTELRRTTKTNENTGVKQRAAPSPGNQQSELTTTTENPPALISSPSPRGVGGSSSSDKEKEKVARAKSVETSTPLRTTSNSAQNITTENDVSKVPKYHAISPTPSRPPTPTLSAFVDENRDRSTDDSGSNTPDIDMKNMHCEKSDVEMRDAACDTSEIEVKDPASDSAKCANAEKRNPFCGKPDVEMTVADGNKPDNEMQGDSLSRHRPTGLRSRPVSGRNSFVRRLPVDQDRLMYGDLVKFGRDNKPGPTLLLLSHQDLVNLSQKPNFGRYVVGFFVRMRMQTGNYQICRIMGAVRGLPYCPSHVDSETRTNWYLNVEVGMWVARTRISFVSGSIPTYSDWEEYKRQIFCAGMHLPAISDFGPVLKKAEELVYYGNFLPTEEEIGFHRANLVILYPREAYPPRKRPGPGRPFEQDPAPKRRRRW